MRNVSNRSSRENQNTFFVQYPLSEKKKCALGDEVEKDGRAGQTTDDNTAHALCMLDS
jgi:hypothetical protein